MLYHISDSFQRLNLSDVSLPRGDYLHTLTDAGGQPVTFSSTSKWYRLNTDPATVYTSGIVFVESDLNALPVSLTGSEIKSGLTDNFESAIRGTGYDSTDGSELLQYRTPNVTEYDITQTDINVFLSSGSFLSTYLKQLKEFLPHWINVNKIGSGLLSMIDVGTHLKYGRDIDSVSPCTKAPVFDDVLYNVFTFDVSIVISLYGDEAEMSTPNSGNKFCFITDIFNGGGASIYLMVPEETRDELSQLSVFEDLFEARSITVKPKGFGISLSKGVNVHSHTTQVELWNGDHMFQYP